MHCLGLFVLESPWQICLAFENSCFYQTVNALSLDVTHSAHLQEISVACSRILPVDLSRKLVAHKVLTTVDNLRNFLLTPTPEMLS